MRLVGGNRIAYPALATELAGESADSRVQQSRPDCTMKSIPVHPEEVTSSWLTEALRSTQTIGQARVKSFKMQPIGMEQGFSGELVRLDLDYSKAENGLPASLVGKFSPIYPHGDDFQQDSSEREIRFYEKAAAKVGLRVPRCHFAAIDRKKGGFTSWR